MRQRGRHRRRRRGQALRATLAGTALALTAAATLISTSQATGANSPGDLTPLHTGASTQLSLHENLASRDTLDTLSGNMGGNVGVDGVLSDADRSMRNASGCSADERDALPVEPTATRAYCWDDADARTPRWRPRSLTTSGDADDDGAWGAHEVILSGWTHRDTRAAAPGRDEGLARIAFVDATDPDALRYRWVLLVAPRAGGKDFAPVRADLGGMVWYQDKLIVTAEHGQGLLLFDLHRLLRADVDSSAVGRVGHGYSAAGYRYVLPAIGSYEPEGGSCTRGRGHAVPCIGSLSLDRTTTPDSLVATEAPGDRPERTRIWRYAFSTAAYRTGLLADAQGHVNAVEAYTTKGTGISGALSHRPSGGAEAEWYIGRPSGDRAGHGSLWRQDGHGAEAATCTADQSHACWSLGSGSLSYWQRTGELWTLSDTADRRVLYAVPLSSVDGSLG
ncbi:hypothetical protein [Streptomyces aureus]|uniref:hypothetical protein n=1 Tax=Streptomyces aureus TaxID=193461 RepID=UPI000561CC5C|nr:hypothetical protein [Streptomyces aureus]